MEQLTIKINNESARVLKKAAKRNLKQLDEYIQEILEWFALKEIDPLFKWKPAKGSGKGVKYSSLNHNKLLYGKKK